MKSIKKINLILIILLIGITVFLLPSCFVKDQVIYSIQEDDTFHFNVNDSVTSAASKPLTLNPGVYRITVDSEILPQEGQFVIDLSYDHDSTSFKAVKYNPVILFGGESHVDFELYVDDTTSDVQLQLALFNADFENINDITISTTSLRNRMQLCISYAVLLIIFLVLKLREKIINKTMTTSRQIAFAGLATCILVCFFPYLNDYFTVGADTGFHLIRIESLKETLLHGNQFPIRVSDYWLYGHGYMNSTFYGELLLYIPAFLRIMGFTLTTASKVLVLLSLIAMAAVGFHCMYRCTKNDYASALGTCYILVSPYLFHNIYNRGALGEYTAMIFLPMVITGVFLLYTEDIKNASYKKHKWYLVIGLTLILQCHLITCEMTGVMLIIFCMIKFKKTFRKETFIQLFEAAVLVLLINASFWFPMIHMMITDSFFFHDLENISIQITGIQFAHLLQITPYKGGFQTGMHNTEQLQPGLTLLAAIGIFALYSKKTKNDSIKTYCTNCFGFIVVLLIMCTKYFPWDPLGKVPGLSFFSNAIQFPYRLLSPIVILGGFFIAFLFLWLKENYNNRTHKLVITMLIFFSIIPALFQTNNIAYVTSPLRLHTAENMGSIGVSNGEYILADTVLNDYHAHPPISGDGIIYSDYNKKGTEITLKVQNLTSQDSYIDMPLIGYRGYVVNKPLSVSKERGFNNDLRIIVPANYSGTLHVAYKEMTLYLIADIVSLLTLLGLLVYAGSIMKKKGEEK